VSRQLSDELRTARDRVSSVSRRLAAAGLVLGTAGNVSEQVGELIAITPTGAALKDLTADQITVIDRDGRVVDGELAPTSELDLHLGVYERYTAGAVVHTHAPVATAVSCVVDELPCIHYQMLLLGGTVRVAPYRTFGTPALAEVTLDALEDRMAALMANHGAIVWAQDLEHAFAQSELLEWACTVYWRAAAIGTPRALDDEDRMAVVAAATQRNYGTTRSIEQ
jgi:L-fuculose-phosphate aldolase